MWPEVRKAQEEKRYELVLVGPEIAKRVEDNENTFDENIYALKQLNFLEVAKTSLSTLSPLLCQMENMANLLIHTNKLTSVPEEIGKLAHLKNLNLSNNLLIELPQSLKNCKELFTVNLSGNQLTNLFPLDNLSKLAVLDISSNKFTKLPEDLGSVGLENLSQINASYNQLEELSDNLVELPSLKVLNVENNVITHVPSNLSQGAKLKDLLMKTNKIKDNRLKKLVEQDKGKAIIDYLERMYVDECKKSKSKKPAAPKDSLIAQKKNKKANDAITEFDRVNILHVNHVQKNNTILHNKVVMDENSGVQDIRPYIICCICKDLDLETPGLFKKFLSIQTKLQDELCEKRTLATIATHDITKLKGESLVYEAKDPNHINFVPLGRKYPITAMEFYTKLQDEAEAERKQKKRNQISGIYKYLNLVEDRKEKFAYVSDNLGNVVSLPPLTNSESTKMSTSTKNIFIEITSSQSIEACKKVMEELFTEMLNAGISTKTLDENANEEIARKVDELSLESEESKDENKKLRHTLVLQQVKVVDTKGTLKTVYPSRVDLSFGDSKKFQVNRLYDEEKV